LFAKKRFFEDSLLKKFDKKDVFQNKKSNSPAMSPKKLTHSALKDLAEGTY